MNTKKVYLSSPVDMSIYKDMPNRQTSPYERVKKVRTRISTDKIYNTDVSIEIPSDFFEGETSDEY